jgi:hypothetical protein
MGGTYCHDFYLTPSRLFKEEMKSFCIRNLKKDTTLKGLSSALQIANRLP